MAPERRQIPRLTWRDARKEDRPALQRFQCTTPKPSGPFNWRKPHPRPYELDVQSFIRTENPTRKDASLLIGLDSEGIGAVVAWAVVGNTDYKILAIAVATRYRGKDGAIGREALVTALEVIEADAVGRQWPTVTVYAFINVRNWPSQTLFHSQGFRSGRSVDSSHIEWTRELGLDSDVQEQ